MVRYKSLLILLLLYFNLFSQDYHPNKVFVKFRQATELENIDYTATRSFNNLALTPLQKVFFDHSIKSITKTSKIKKEAFQRIYTLSIQDSAKLDHLILELKKNPDVEVVEKVPVYKAFFVPNDLHPNQWHLSKINAQQAWDISTGNPSVTVAIVDDAVKINHEDLQGNIWTNPGEIPNNNIDDDNNGYIDDVNGYDVADGDNDPSPPSAFASDDVFTHGTHCAGIASAVSGNNKGIASIGYSVKIIPVKTKLSSTSDNTLTSTYEGVEYAIAAGAKVISMSWGGSGYSYVFQDLFNYAHDQGIVLVAAAGNNSSSDPFYPAAYDHIISVGATDNTDHVAYFSNYGTTIDIMAPGLNIWSTLAGSPSSYGYLSGTSMACPLVAGTLALMRSVQPSLPPDAIESCVKNTADNINALNPSYTGLIGGGRINAYNAMRCASSSVYADFNANPATVCSGMTVTITDLSIGGTTNWTWSFPGANPSSSTLKNPLVSYPNPGKYSIALRAANSTDAGSLIKTNYITVYKPSGALSGTTTIQQGNTAYIRIDFTGVAPFNFSISDGANTINQTNIFSNPFYLAVSPPVTKTYSLTALADSNCTGIFSGNAIVTVITGGSSTCPTTDGLVAYYPFDGDANDISGNSLNGTIQPGITNTTDRFGSSTKALAFPGGNTTGNGVLIANNSALNFNTSYSISMWFKFNSTNTYDWEKLLSKGRDVNNSYGISIMPSTSTLNFTHNNGNGTSYTTTGTFSGINSWHMVTAVLNQENDNLKIYIDGKLCGTSSYASVNSFINNSNPVSIGYHQGDAYYQYPFNGSIDEVKFFTRALSDCEITKLYDCNAICNIPCAPTTGLVAFYPFENNTNDQSGDGVNPTTSIAVTYVQGYEGTSNTAGYFNGSASNMNVSETPKLNFLGTATGYAFSLWAKLSSTQPNKILFHIRDASGNETSLNTFNSDGRISLHNGTNGTQNTQTALQLFPLNQWVHFAGNYDYGSNTSSLYINGVLQQQSTTNTIQKIGNSSLKISGHIINTGFEFTGSIDDVRLFDRSLTFCEIVKLYNCTTVCGFQPTCAPTNGLAAYYSLDGNAIDMSGNGNNGSFLALAGTEMFSADRFSNPASSASFQQLSYTHSVSLGYPGGNGYYQVNNTLGNFRTNDFTLSAWINMVNSTTGSNVLLSKRQHDFSGNQFELGVSNNRPYFFIATGNSPTSPGYNDTIFIYASPILPGQWYHIGAVRKNNVISLYINGQLNAVSAQKTIDINNTYQFLIGASKPVNGVYYDSFGFFNGQADEIRVYNQALSDCEMAKLYDCTTVCSLPSACGTTDGLIAHYPFDGNTLDATGSGANGTIMGTGITLTTDRSGNPNSAYNFDGTPQQSMISPMNLRSIIGISMWFKASGSNTNPYPTFYILDDDYTLNTLDITPGYFYSTLITKPGLDDLFARVDKIGDDLYSTSMVSSDVWHHYYCSYDGPNKILKLYLDGVLLGTKNLTIPGITLNNNYLRLGKSSTIGNNGDQFMGQIDEVRIYNRVLSDCEVAQLYNCSVTCGLVASYPFCGNANDVTGNGYNGSISGASLAADRFGNANSAYYFNGINNKISVDAFTNLNDLSISYWFKVPSGSGNINTIYPQIAEFYDEVADLNATSASFTSGNYIRPYIGAVPNNIYSITNDHGAQVNCASNNIYTVDVWYHVTSTYSRATGLTALYVNNSLVKTVTSINMRNITSLVIGAAHGASVYNYFDGFIDDMKIYNKVLSAAEILALYNEPAPCTSTVLAASYPFCGNANDVSGNENNGTIAGSTFDTDRFGNPNTSAHFDGGSQHIKIPRPISTDFSIVAWFKTTQIASNQTSWINGASIVDAETWGCVRDFGVSLINGGKIAFGVGKDGNCYPVSYTSANDYNDGNWHMVVTTRSYSTGTLSMYVDNVLLGSITSTDYTSILDSPPYIGIGRNTGNIMNNAGENFSFIGDIDDVKIYTGVISAGDVNTLFNAPAPCTSPCTLSISGSNTGCLTQNAIYSASPANTVNWTVTGGSFVKLSNNTISVNWTLPGSNMVYASETVCGVSYALPVTINCCISNANVTLAGSATGCLKDSSSGTAIYELLGALPSSYPIRWTIYGGTFKKIAPNAISVTWTDKSYNRIIAEQTVCGIVADRYITVQCCNALATTRVLGNTTVCKDSTNIYMTANVSVSDIYNWTIPGASVLKLNNYAVQVKWTSIGQKKIHAAEQLCNTNADLIVNVQSCAVIVRTITGTNQGCVNTTHNYMVNSTTSSYIWVVNGGSFTTPSFGSNSITVTWTSIGQNFVNAIDLSNGQTYSFPVMIVCCGNTEPQFLPYVSLDLSGQDMLCNTVGTISLRGGSPPGGYYSYNGYATTFLDVSASGVYPLVYHYTDPFACTNTASASLIVNLCTVPGPCDLPIPSCTCPGYTCPPPFKIYTAITPNGDQFNDFWVMDSLPLLPAYVTVTILDKWGNELYHNGQYENDWNGTDSKGKALPAGIYYYIVELQPGKRKFTGTVAIVRN